MKKRLKITFNAPVVLSIGAISLIALLLNNMTKGYTNEMFFMTYRSSFVNPLTYLRFVTHVFGHADWEHFIGNMAYILLLGPILEEKYKSSNIVGVVFITAVVTALVNYFFFPTVALCGASGLVFAFILLVSFTEFRAGEIPLTFILVAVIFIGKEIFQGMFVMDNVSNLSHIIGGIIGSFIGYKFNRK